MRFLIALLMVALISACSAPPEGSNELTQGDVAELRALDQAYGQAWMEDGTAAQRQALLALFEEDAIALPGASQPIEGREGLNEFWFPEGYPPTIVRSFDRETTSVVGNAQVAAITGKARFDYSYDGTETKQASNYLIVARPDSSGNWRIAKIMWGSRTLDD